MMFPPHREVAGLFKSYALNVRKKMLASSKCTERKDGRDITVSIALHGQLNPEKTRV